MGRETEINSSKEGTFLKILSGIRPEKKPNRGKDQASKQRKEIEISPTKNIASCKREEGRDESY